MQSTKWGLILLWLVSALYGQATYSEESTAVQRLLKQGYYWFEQGRHDLAESAWRKVLMMEPDNKEAQAGLGELSSVKTIKRGNHEKLQQARQLIEDKQYDVALQVYRQFFQGQTPSGELALEYYQTLGGTEAGWPEAIKNLEILMEKHPSNPRYVLVLGQVKTYREKTRREGIKLLASISEKSSVRKEAITAQRQALLWLDGRKEDEPLYRNYLTQSGEQDVELEEKIAGLGKAGRGVGLGYQLLDEKKIKQAKAEFKQVIKDEPENADAWAGMGLIKLRQQSFKQADTLLTKAMKLAPERKQQWQKARLSARYWFNIKQGDKARRKGNLNQAKQFVTQARKLRPNHKEGLLLQAQIRAGLGKEAKAIKTYRRILDRYPKDKRAKQGLMAVLSHSEDHQQIARLVKRYGLPEKEFQGQRMSKEAESLLSEAQQIKGRNKTLALAKMRAAQSLDPDHVWLNYELAKLYLQYGRHREAYAVFDGLLFKQPDNQEAIYARALLSQQSKDWLYGIDILENIPKKQRTKLQQVLLENLYGQYQQEQISKRLASGNYTGAQQLVDELSQRSAEKPAMMMMLAQSQAALGQSEKALSTAQLALVKNTGPASVDLQMSYANVLFKTGQYQEFDRLVRQLEQKQRSRPLTQQQQQAIHQMALGKSLNEVDRLRKQDRLIEAYEALLPWLESDSGNQNVLGLMAELYKASGDHARALDIYQQTIELNPENVHHYMNAANEAIILNDYDRAEAYINDGFKLNPEEPNLYVLRGNLKQIKGDKSAAAKDLQHALSHYDARNREGKHLYPPSDRKPRSPTEQRFPFQPHKKKYKRDKKFKAVAQWGVQ